MKHLKLFNEHVFYDSVNPNINEFEFDPETTNFSKKDKRFLMDLEDIIIVAENDCNLYVRVWINRHSSKVKWSKLKDFLDKNQIIGEIAIEISYHDYEEPNIQHYLNRIVTHMNKWGWEQFSIRSGVDQELPFVKDGLLLENWVVLEFKTTSKWYELTKVNESIDSDRRAFTNWSKQIEQEFDEDLFQLFLANRSKLKERNIYNYNGYEHLRIADREANENPSVKQFQKKISLWNKLDINYDILYQSEQLVILHPKDFESERIISSGCNVCTNFKHMYDNYVKSGSYFFDILDIKSNKRFFGTFGHDVNLKSKAFNIVDKSNKIVIQKYWDESWKKWILVKKSDDFISSYDWVIDICQKTLQDKFLN